MYKVLAISALAVGLAFPASAQSLRSDSSSAAGALANANSAAGAVSLSQGGQGGGGGNVTFNTGGHSSTSSRIESSGRIHNTYGDQTIKTAPQVVAPSMSSGHPCAYAPVSMALSVIGFGGAIGGQRIDDACLLAQMGVRDASISMIAARNPSACRALEAVGRIRAGSCGGRQAAVTAYAVPSQRPVARPAPRHKVTSTSQTIAYDASIQPQKVRYSDLKSGDLYQKNGVIYRKR